MRYPLLLSLLAAFFAASCDDLGDPVTPPAAPSNAPVITTILPDSGAVGDTVTISGSRFGAAQGTSTIAFGAVTASPVGVWTDTLLRTTVPAGAVTGAVKVTVNGTASTGRSFKVLGTVAISFAADIAPIFTARGCAGCHGGSGGLTVTTYASLMAGGNSGAAVVPFDGEGSRLVRKLRGTAGARMPLGGSALPENEILKFVQWIDQGAPNN